MEVVAQSVRRDDEEDLQPLSVLLVHAPVAGFDAPGLQFVAGPPDVRDADRRALAGGIAAVDREADSHAVALKRDRRLRAAPPLDFPQPEGVAVPARGGVDVRHRQGEHVVAIGEGRLVEFLRHDAVVSSDV